MGNTFRNRVRVAGSGFTVFTYAGQTIAFAQQIAHTSPQPVGQGSSAIHPMDEPYPIEIITPAAAGMGQLTLNLFELYGQGRASKVWDRLGGDIQYAPQGTGSFGSVGDANNASTNLNIGKGIFGGAVDIVDVFIRQAQAEPSKLNVTKLIKPLPTEAGGATQVSTEEYHGCIITNVIDGETIEVGTLEIIKQITIAYRFMTRDGNPSAAFALRDNHLGK